MQSIFVNSIIFFPSQVHNPIDNDAYVKRHKVTACVKNRPPFGKSAQQ